MRVDELIRKKRDGGRLSAEEIAFLVRGAARGDIPDYQLAAFLMATFLRGMDERETADLTMAMAASGEQVDLAAAGIRAIDKHSTGGVGDKVSLVAAPLVAAAGVPVAKMSGRGLGHTGGTLDKLESIPGFRVELGRDEMIQQVRRIGIALVGQSRDLVPADKRLYALRDVTATVDSVPLIASSVMSKKLAGGAAGIVLDVKAGRGAFMTGVEEAVALARAMVAIGRNTGRATVAVVSDMDQPLGCAVGNSLEVAEAVKCLRGEGPPDLERLALVLGAHMLRLAGERGDLPALEDRLRRLLRDGSALGRFRALVEAQGGDPRVVDDPCLLPAAPVELAVPAPCDGVVADIDPLAVGRVAMDLGAGRRTKEDVIDHAVGVLVWRKVGHAVRAGEPVGAVFMRHAEPGFDPVKRVLAAYRFAATAAPRPLVHAVIE